MGEIPSSVDMISLSIRADLENSSGNIDRSTVTVVDISSGAWAGVYHPFLGCINLGY